MKKLLTFFCVAALLLPVLLTGCGSGGATTVRLNEVTHSVFYAPQYVAMSLGFFADEGLNVELTAAQQRCEDLYVASSGEEAPLWPQAARPAKEADDA